MAGCTRCGRPLPPRTDPRGRPRRFCSATCRSAARRQREAAAGQTRGCEFVVCGIPCGNPASGALELPTGAVIAVCAGCAGVAARWLGRDAEEQPRRLAGARQDGKPELSPRESDVVRRFVADVPVARIARELDVRAPTVHQYLRRVREKYQKLGRQAKTRIELYERAIEDGIVASPVERRLLDGSVPTAPAHHLRREVDRFFERAGGHREIVLSGMAGVGKSQIAATHARRVWAQDLVDVVIWTPAGSREQIISHYAQTAVALLNAPPQDPEHAAAQLLTWLNTTARRWLLVLDDLWDPRDLRGLQPATAEGNQVVITTRRRDAELISARRQVVTVDLFTPPEAAEFLVDRLPGRADPDGQARALASDLGYLPLALSQAAAYMVDRELSYAEYRRRWNDRRKKVIDLVSDDLHGTLAAAWSLSIELANQLDPVGVAEPLLDLMSVLDAAGAPVELFATGAVLAYLGEESGRRVGQDDARDAVRCLERLNLSMVDLFRPEHGVQTHPLVQRVSRDRMTPRHLARVARVAARALVELWPVDSGSDTGLARSLRANSVALQAHAGSLLWTSGETELVFRTGANLGHSQHVLEAITYFEDAVETAAVLPPAHPDVLRARAEAARWHGKAGHTGAAVDGLAQVLADLRAVLGPDHVDTVTTRAWLAFALAETGDDDTDLGALLTDLARLLGPDHPDALTTRRLIANRRGHDGDPAGAVRDLEQVRDGQLRVLGAEHPDTAATEEDLRFWLDGIQMAQLEPVLAEQRLRARTPSPLVLSWVVGEQAAAQGVSGVAEPPGRSWAGDEQAGPGSSLVHEGGWWR
ncbi:NB-ARC domain-containing protein [Actinokineospora cianjurensis]|uniref:Tetratricopeptide repeat protein n=1 Tax=Actinokineospora cianjurensis TaxID=585224 RepID=A0A421BB75_9PSEU|nr:NB-ARC domain-containing protein [Actinokineospora cianjurensis]RLK61600.1 tetratricopeptide repeat protein [Actinokineospora cianjurensis]